MLYKAFGATTTYKAVKQIHNSNSPHENTVAFQAAVFSKKTI